MTDITVSFGGQPIDVQVGENTALVAQQAGIATAEADRAETAADEIADSLDLLDDLSSLRDLTPIHVGREDTPTLPTNVLARTWAFADTVEYATQGGTFSLYLSAPCDVRALTFSSSGVIVQNELVGPLADTVAGVNTFALPDTFTLEPGQYVGFYAFNCGFTSGTPADGSGWWAGNGSQVNVNTGVAPTTHVRLEASFVLGSAKLASFTGPDIPVPPLPSDARAIVLPPALNWSPVTFGIKPDGYAAHNYNPQSFLPIDGPEDADHLYYVDPVNGSDSFAGTAAAPFKSLYRALHNVSGSKWIRLLGDTDYATCALGATLTAHPVVIVPYGVSRAAASMRFKGLAWSLVAGTVGTYEATCPAAPIQVWDEAEQSPYGPFAKYLDISTVSSGELEPGSRYISGNTVRVRLHDSRAPDDSVKVMPAGDQLNITAATSIWTDGIDFEGGTAFFDEHTGTRTLVCLNNGEMRYGTRQEAMSHLYGVTDAIFYNMKVFDTRRDGFSYGGNARFIEIDCGGALCGIRFTIVGGAFINDTISNISTAHSGTAGIRVSTAEDKGIYTLSGARPVHDVQGCTSLIFGIKSGNSLGTEDYGRVAFVVGNPGDIPTTMYLLNARVADVTVGTTQFAFAVNSGAALRAYSFDRNGLADYNAPVAFLDWNPFA